MAAPEEVRLVSEAWRQLFEPGSVLERQLDALWGKSPERGGGHRNILLQHLFDAMAAGERLWDEFLPCSLRSRLEELTSGNGRRFFVWLCGLHDLGKATPDFQGQHAELARQVRSTGLWLARDRPAKVWRHERSSGVLLRAALKQAWGVGSRDQIAWVWPLVAGHHGLVPLSVDPRPIDREERLGHRPGKTSSWGPVQELLTHIVTTVAGWPDLAAARPCAVPTRAEQLAISGFVIMADWVASDESRFVGVDDWDKVSFSVARVRAEKAWTDLRLRRGWGSLAARGPELFDLRFHGTPRPLQTCVLAAANAMSGPGLMVIEAPTGEGKTEAALLAAEVLAARWGCDGVYVAMPTQGTSDAMYTRVGDWLGTFGAPLPLALLHGKRLLSEGLLAKPRGEAQECEPELDPYGVADAPPSYRSVAEDAQPNEAFEAPAEWFYGRYRGLLAANGVGTVDQALLAATRTKFVALRYAGLAGKVVIFDEVHAADCYQTVFLSELLFWLGNGRTPVVLLSATLPPSQRQELVDAYISGAAVAPAAALSPIPTSDGYPYVLTACATEAPQYGLTSSRPWRQSARFAVSTLTEDRGDGPGRVLVDRLDDRLAEGGCALVIRNTVRRAQATFLDLSDHFGDDVVLLHSRFTANARAKMTAELLEKLGKDATKRPRRLVVVATQVAEQSFDVDADLLVTDLAPIDLVLQRAGRLHRHDRPASARPSRLRTPEVIVTGLQLEGVASPWFPKGSLIVYGRHLLLRAAALVLEAATGGGWSVPADVPGLVARGYGDEKLGPASWAETAAAAANEYRGEVDKRRARAEPFRLSRADQRGHKTLEGLHDVRDNVHGTEEAVRVRDGDMGQELILVVEGHDGLRTVDGLRLGPNGDAGRDRVEEVLGASLRLPISFAGTPDVQALRPLPGWEGDPWLGRFPALRLDDNSCARLGDRVLRYDRALGLVTDAQLHVRGDDT